MTEEEFRSNKTDPVALANERQKRVENELRGAVAGYIAMPTEVALKNVSVALADYRHQWIQARYAEQIADRAAKAGA